MEDEKDSKVRLSDFKKMNETLIATNENSYVASNSYLKPATVSLYTVEDIVRIIETGQPAQLKEISKVYFYTSGIYRRILAYYATLLLYSNIVIPHVIDPKKSISDPKLSKRYYESLDFIEKLEVPTIAAEIATCVLRDGAYYGLVRDYGADGVRLQDLPFDYCRSRFKNFEGLDVVEIDLRYFNSIKEKEVRDKIVASFPKEVQKDYKQYTNGGSSNYWSYIPAGMALYIDLIEEKPFFLNIIPAIIDLKEYRLIEKNKDSQEIKKIIVQKVGITNDGELIFEPDEAAEMHSGVVGMLKNNKDIDVLTTYNDITLESMVDSARQTITNNLQKITTSIYAEAGVSNQLFATEGNLALEKSIQNDMALMKLFSNRLAIFIQALINKRFSDNKIVFGFKILPISQYNLKDYAENSYKLASLGYSFLVPALATGLSQRDLLDIKKLENTLLELSKYLIPLQSAFTTSGKSDAGGQTKSDEEKKPTSVANEVSKDTGGGT